jgi:hypothetical protein
VRQAAGQHDRLVRPALPVAANPDVVPRRTGRPGHQNPFGLDDVELPGQPVDPGLGGRVLPRPRALSRLAPHRARRLQHDRQGPARFLQPGHGRVLPAVVQVVVGRRGMARMSRI